MRLHCLRSQDLWNEASNIHNGPIAMLASNNGDANGMLMLIVRQVLGISWQMNTLELDSSSTSLWLQVQGRR